MIEYIVLLVILTGQRDRQANPPAYIREIVDGARHNAVLSQWEDDSGRGIVSYIGDHDIDVSADQKTWFHLFGPYCLQKLPTWSYHFSDPNVTRCEYECSKGHHIVTTLGGMK